MYFDPTPECSLQESSLQVKCPSTHPHSLCSTFIGTLQENKVKNKIHMQFSVAHHFVSLLDRCPLQIMVHYFSLNNDNLLKFIRQLVTNEFLVAKFYSY